MKKIYNGSCSMFECPTHTKIVCTLKELKLFFTRGLWSDKYRYPRNSVWQEFMDCFDPLTW